MSAELARRSAVNGLDWLAQRASVVAALPGNEGLFDLARKTGAALPADGRLLLRACYCLTPSPDEAVDPDRALLRSG